MRVYLISNAKKFTGSVQVSYDMTGKLQKIDFSQAILDVTDLEKMLKVLSSSEGSLKDSFKSADTVIVQGDFEVSFEDFWREYPHKRNRFSVEKQWSKLKKEEQVQAFISASEYRKYLVRESWCKPKIADTWLKEKQFLNDWKSL